MSKAKCPDCKLLFESSFENNIEIKTCPCCGYIGPVDCFMCKEEDWIKKDGFKKSFLVSLKKKGEEKESKLKKVKTFNKKIKGEKIDMDKLF